MFTASSSPQESTSGTVSPENRLTVIHIQQTDALARIITHIMGDSVSLDIDMTFLEKANTIQDKSLKNVFKLNL